MHASDNQNPRALLRKNLRQQRRALSADVQHRHAQALTKNISRLPAYRNAKRLAFYLATDGEINTHYLIDRAWHDNKQVYLPIVPTLGRALFFAPYFPDSKLKTNCFGIYEPVCHPRLWLRARQLSLILLPLVAFDAHGNRLGMGGGFYDSSLAFIRYRKQTHSPKLIGLAHALQKIPQLPCESWDIPLDMIATEQQIYKF